MGETTAVDTVVYQSIFQKHKEPLIAERLFHYFKTSISCQSKPIPKLLVLQRLILNKLL